MAVSSGIYRSTKVAPLKSIVDEISYRFYVTDIKSNAFEAFVHIEKADVLKVIDH